MTNYNIETNNLLTDFESFSETGIELSSEQVDRAVELSDHIPNSERQWQTYLNALALFGFEIWLQSRDNSLIINSENCSVNITSIASYIDGVFNLTVGEYKVCLLTKGVAIDEFISIHRAVIDIPKYTAHFYVLVDVVEEQSEVNINSFISFDEIIQRKQATNIVADADWTYELPLAWFNLEPDNLLLNLRCLEPSIITLPTTVATPNNIQSQLESLLPELQSKETALHELLTWEQAVPILSDPNLLAWLYDIQTAQPTAQDALASLRNWSTLQPSERLSETISEVTQRVINLKSWLSDELDELAQNLAWTLLPAPAFATSAFRNLEVINRESPAEEFEAIVTQLRNSGEDIPEQARGACQDFSLVNHEMRLFAVIWEIEETPGMPEWILLLVLGAKANNFLPQGLKLELKQDNALLDERVASSETADSYLYIQVIGKLDEQFTVNISLKNGETFVFPTFAFN